MGLDIYAGTLTRYYAHNWKTAVQQWAEENGYSFQRITADGRENPNGQEMSPFAIQEIIEDCAIGAGPRDTLQTWTQVRTAHLRSGIFRKTCNTIHGLWQNFLSPSFTRH